MNIEKEIKEYISCKEINSALLITGKWGCGKTFLIDQIASDLDKGQDYTMIRISLFGIDSIDGFNRAVKEKYLFTLLNPISKSQKLISKVIDLTSVFKEVSKVAKGINAVLSIDLNNFVKVEKIIKCVQDKDIIKKELILVFDDLERSQIDKIELLGAINNYLENQNIKTILIADEEKIEDEKYAEFKEKLIMRTIKIKPDYEIIIKAIIKTYNETSDGYKEFITKNVEQITQVFLESQSENIRTLKSIIIEFERVYAVWKASDVPMCHLNSVLYAYCAIMFEAKAGEYKSDSNFGYTFSKLGLDKKYCNLKRLYILGSLETWAEQGEWNEDEITSEIIEKFSSHDISYSEKFLLYGFWDLTEVLIAEALPDLLSKAYDGELSFNDVIDILSKLYWLDKYEINVPCDIDCSKIISGIKRRTQLIISGKANEPDNMYTHIPPVVLEELRSDFRKTYDYITKTRDRLPALKNRLNYIAYLNETDHLFPIKIESYTLVSFDAEMLESFTRKYKREPNSNRNYSISLLGKMDFLHSDIEEVEETIDNFNKLKGKLDVFRNEEPDQIAKIQIGENISQLDEVIAKLQQQFENKPIE